MGPLARDSAAQHLLSQPQVTRCPVTPTSVPHRCLAVPGKAGSSPGPPAAQADPSSQPQAQPGPPNPVCSRLGTAPHGAQRPPLALRTTGLGEGQARTADPVGVVPPVDTDARVGAQGRVGLQAGAL